MERKFNVGYSNAKLCSCLDAERTCYFSPNSNPPNVPVYFPNYATYQRQLTFSPYVNPPNMYYPVSRVQNEHAFSRSCSFYDASYGNVIQHTLLPCFSLNGTSRRPFFNVSSATHNGSLIPRQHTLSPSLLGFNSLAPILTYLLDSASANYNCSRIPQHSLSPYECFDNTEFGRGYMNPDSRHLSDVSSATHNGSLIQQHHALSHRGSFGNIKLARDSAILNRSDDANSPSISLQSLLLAELEFRKLFLVHSYVGRLVTSRFPMFTSFHLYSVA